MTDQQTALRFYRKTALPWVAITAITFLVAGLAQQAFAAFGYYSPISINSAQVPSTQTDFPVLVSVTDARFKTVANSGHVQNASGFDIRPYSDSAGSSAITGYELERYNATTGEVVMWVKVSSLSSSTTPIYLFYGDSGISTDGSSTTTWSNSFLRVYHLKDGTTLNLTDSTGSGDDGGNSGGVTATAGKIDGAASFASASSQKINLSNTVIPTAITVSAWANPTTLPNTYNTVYNKGSGANYYTIDVKSSGKLAMGVIASNSRAYDGTGATTLSTGTLYYLVLTYDSSAGLVGYVNASVDQTVTANGSLNTSNQGREIGHNGAFNCCFWNGVIDEVRDSSVARSANWITTEYNNQSAPGTFETLGSEVAVTTGASGWFYFFP